MTTTTTRPKAPARVQCPHCTYGTDATSLQAHIALAHPEVPMDAIAPKRSARNDAQAGTSAPVEIPPSVGAALLPEATLEQISLELVDVGDNVRVTLEAIDELAASIAEHGVLQPVKATLLPDGRYRLLWGQRRVLAARQAGLATIPALVHRGGDIVDRPVEQLVENLHRADLNPIDRARAMRAVVDSGVSQADLARKLGIGPSTVANDLRLLTLDNGVVEAIRAGDLSAAHGKAIASLPAKQQKELAESVVKEKLSAHALESRIKWKSDEAAADQARVNRTVKWIPKAIKALEAAEVPKDADISLRSASYRMDEHAFRDGLKAAGWKRHSYGYRSERPEGCDCTAVAIDCGGLKPTIVPVCANDKHDDKGLSPEARRAQWEEERKAREEQLGRFRAAVRYELSVARPRERMCRVLLDVLSQVGWYRSADGEAKRREALAALTYDEVLDRVADAVATDPRARNVPDVDSFIADVVAAGWKGHAPTDPAPDLLAAAKGKPAAPEATS